MNIGEFLGVLLLFFIILFIFGIFIYFIVIRFLFQHNGNKCFKEMYKYYKNLNEKTKNE